MRPHFIFLSALCSLTITSCRDADPNVTAAKPPPTKTSEMTAEQHGRLLKSISDQIEKELIAFSETEFKTQAEASEAMMQLTPAGSKQQERVQSALKDAGITSEAFAVFVEKNPEIVAENTETFEKQLEATLEKHKDKLEALAKQLTALPPGDLEGARQKNAALLEHAQARTKRSSQKPRLSRWTQVGSLSQLKTALKETERPTIIRFRAAWAFPTIEQEKKLFSDETVKTELTEYALIVVDVTEPNDEVTSIQKEFQANSLPAILVFSQPKSILKALENGVTPTPSATFKQPTLNKETFLNGLPQ